MVVVIGEDGMVRRFGRRVVTPTDGLRYALVEGGGVWAESCNNYVKDWYV